MKKQREQTENNQNNPGNKNSDANTSNPNGNVNNPNNNNNNINRAERKPKTVYPPCETCGKANHSTERCYHGANAAKRPPPRQRRPERQNQVQERANQNDSIETTQAAVQNLTEYATSSLRSCDWQTGGNSFNTSINPSGCLAATSGDLFKYYS